MPTVQTEKKPNNPGSSAGDLTGQLGWYYARLFPLDLLTRWLRYQSDETLSCREISFTLQNDVYIRWKAFRTSKEFLDDLGRKLPVKIDIGAIYNTCPERRNNITGTLTPVEKELVFDIDMTDYEDVLGDLAGGSATEMCDRNWRYMSTAVKVIDIALREDFGFSCILWVYSGRRGIHCWVADHRARIMTNEQRSAVAEYLHIRFEGREHAGRRQTVTTIPLHPALARAKRVACDETFHQFVLGDQGLLNTDERIVSMTDLIPNRNIATDIREKLLRLGPGRGVEKWEKLKIEITKAAKIDMGVRATADYIVLRYTYPRLDINVSKEINHLLKAPFCVHPSTGRVCVPFRAADADVFEPAKQAPQLAQLLNELENGKGRAMQCLDEGKKVLEEFVLEIEKESRNIARRQRLEELDRKNVAEIMA